MVERKWQMRVRHKTKRILDGLKLRLFRLDCYRGLYDLVKSLSFIFLLKYVHVVDIHKIISQLLDSQ